MTDKYEKLANQEYLNAKQLTLMSLIVIIIIQSIPFFIPQSPQMEWILLGFTAAVSACAVVGAILVQHNADKITLLYQQAFNAEFYATIDALNQVRKEVMDDDETASMLPEMLGFAKAWMKAHSSPIDPPTPEDLGISKPDPNVSEDELFS